MKRYISASILSANFSCLEKEIRACEQSGVDWIHIDVMDGHFVPNITMGPFIVEACKRITSLPLDCHLMIEKPENYIPVFAKAGASIITIHPEGNHNVQQSLLLIKSLGAKAGIALNPETSIDEIIPFLEIVDLVLVMTVHPGYSGQKYIPQTTQKIMQISSLCQKRNLSPIIEVDGGISVETLTDPRDAGANAFVAATAIFRHSDGIQAGVQSLHSLLL